MDIHDHNRVCAYINLDDLRENIKSITKHVGENIKIMAVVKADAYGHGAINIAQELMRENTTDFAVATVDEGIMLRKNGITTPILVLGYTFENKIDAIIDYDLSQAISSYEQAVQISKSAKEKNKNVKIHIEIDTGMTRLGFLYNSLAIDEIVKISQVENLDLIGMFTHFSKADEKDEDYTLMQIRKFNEIIEQLQAVNINIPLIHVSNSAGTINYKQSNFNMVRPGLSLYGLYPSEEVNKGAVCLKPILSLVSHIISIKAVEKDTPVSYGGTFVTNRKTVVAVVPVGYGDGYPRRLSSCGRVIIKGQYAPIIGRVCMDQFMVDITDIENVNIEDEVILIGKSYGLEITVEEIAELVGTINYEIICQLGKRIPRVYYKNGKNTHTINDL